MAIVILFNKKETKLDYIDQITEYSIVKCVIS